MAIFVKIMHSMKKVTPEEQCLLNKKIFQRPIELANVESLSEQEREKYELELEYSSTYLSVVDTAEQKGFYKGFVKGFDKGVEQGIVKGIEQGITQCISNGREEGIEEGFEYGLAKCLAKGENPKLWK